MNKNINKNNLDVLILAAGKGSRFSSTTPKPLALLAHQPLIGHVLKSVEKLSHALACQISPTILANSNNYEPIARYLEREHEKNFSLHIQDENTPGTGGALKSFLKHQKLKDYILVLYADTPFVRACDLLTLLNKLQEHVISIAALELENPKNYGRLILTKEGFPSCIIEEKDLDESMRHIKLCNGGVMALKSSFCIDATNKLPLRENSNEYYLTDLLSLAHKNGERSSYTLFPPNTLQGINTPQELSKAEVVIQNILRTKAMKAGVHLIDPYHVYLSFDTKIEAGVTIEPFVVIGPKVHIQKEAYICSFSHIEGATIGVSARVGPFARLRPHSELSPYAHAGSFVELKNTKLGIHSKANHLSYLGDATIGDNVNVGAGVVTCNFDGLHKHRTTIESEAFIGSNSALVAPVNIGYKSYVGAGSTITKSVKESTLALARAYQVEKSLPEIKNKK